MKQEPIDNLSFLTGKLSDMLGEPEPQTEAPDDKEIPQVDKQDPFLDEKGMDRQNDK